MTYNLCRVVRHRHCLEGGMIEKKFIRKIVTSELSAHGKKAILGKLNEQERQEFLKKLQVKCEKKISDLFNTQLHGRACSNRINN